MSRSKVYSVSDEEFRNIIKESNNYTECLTKLGLSTSGGSSKDILIRRIKELECSTKHFGMKRVKGYENIKYSLEEILIENSPYTNTSRLKGRLIKEGIFEYRCQQCGITEWQNKPLALHLDHINGINNDNRIENLRLLCPNCHAQTDTYAGKNIKYIKKKHCCIDCGKEITTKATRCIKCFGKYQTTSLEEIPISRIELKYLIYTTPFTEIGRQFNVSDAAVKKWCDKFNLPRNKSDITKYSEDTWNLL